MTQPPDVGRPGGEMTQPTAADIFSAILTGADAVAVVLELREFESADRAREVARAAARLTVDYMMSPTCSIAVIPTYADHLARFMHGVRLRLDGLR